MEKQALSPEQIHLRTQKLIGAENVRALACAHVLLVGVGGVGGHAAEALARAGVGRLTLVDGDVFAPSNLNRQRFCTIDSLRQPKAVAAAGQIGQFAPFTRVSALQKRLTPEDLPELFGQSYDYVIDAIDDIPCKLALAVYCQEQKIPLVSSMGAGNRMGTESFRIGDIFQTQYDPLARAMRTRLRKAGVGRLDVCWSPEPPATFDADRTGAPASISFVPAMAGLTLAGYVIRRLCSAPSGWDQTKKEQQGT